MTSDDFIIESKKPFSESLIWQLNKDYYNDNGIAAWSDQLVPHNITSNSAVAASYAELFFAMLRDLSNAGSVTEVVYLLELGAGHGRFCFHILRHLDKLIAEETEVFPKYCYVLSDIAEDNLAFFSEHPQLQSYYDRGVLDISYFDATQNNQLNLRKSNQQISAGDLKQPIFALANYFFDSLPNDLYHLENKRLSTCSVSLSSKIDTTEMSSTNKIEHMNLSYHQLPTVQPVYADLQLNEILNSYHAMKKDTYIFFPKMAIDCLANIAALSEEGMILLTMDKGCHNMDALEGKERPDLVKHGSFSFLVNFHALSEYCIKKGGKSMFPRSTMFSIEMGCLIFSNEASKYKEVQRTYDRVIDRFNPDDFNAIKKMAYANVTSLDLKQLTAIYRLSAYDSTIFIKLLPRLKKVSKRLSVKERNSIEYTVANIWSMYFDINEKYDLAYELGGLMYDLAYYDQALTYFDYSNTSYGVKEDVYYNMALCHYQLRQDVLFSDTVKAANLAFPDSRLIKGLSDLDMS